MKTTDKVTSTFFFAIMIVISLIMLCSCGNEEIKFLKNEITVLCGETYNINELNSLNGDYEATYISTNRRLRIDGETVTALETGVGRIYADVDGIMVYFDVIIKGNYIDLLSFDKDVIYLNYDETKSNSSNFDTNYDMPYSIVYSEVGYISYDVFTGEIKPIYDEHLQSGEKDIVVSIEYHTSATKTRISSFTVHFTTYDYVNTVNINKTDVSKSCAIDVSMFLSDSIDIPFSIKGSATFEPELSDITDLSLNKVSALDYVLTIFANAVGVHHYEVRIENGMVNGEFTYITIAFNVEVVERISVSGYAITLDDVDVGDELYVGERYEVQVYTDAIFDGMDKANGYYSFSVLFESSGEHSITKHFTMTTDSGTDEFDFKLDVNVYKTPEDFVLLLNSEIVLDEATLSIIDESYASEAMNDGVFSVACIEIDGLDDDAFGKVSIECSNDCVVFEKDTMTLVANRAGTCELTVKVGGRQFICKSYTINVTEIVVDEICLDKSEVVLYELNDNGLSTYEVVNISISPVYAKIKELDIVCESTCITYSLDMTVLTLTFAEVGECEIYINGEMLKVYCLPVVDDIKISVAGKEGLNFVITDGTSAVVSVVGLKDGKEVILPFGITSENDYIIYDGGFTIKLVADGVYSVKIAMEHIIKTITIRVSTNNPASISVLNIKNSEALEDNEVVLVTLNIQIVFANGDIIRTLTECLNYVDITCDKYVEFDGESFALFEIGEYIFTVASKVDSSICTTFVFTVK